MEDWQERAKQLADDHWGYIEQVLLWADVSKIRIETLGEHYKNGFISGYEAGHLNMTISSPEIKGETRFHYVSAKEHGYKHGIEDIEGKT